jgi:glucokinase
VAEGMLALDVGGTSVKSAVMDAACRPLPGSLSRRGFIEGAGLDKTLEPLISAVKAGCALAAREGLCLSAVGAAFPGPFDFKLGISQMTHKLPQLYGLPLGDILSKAADGLPVRFLHDSTAFILGEAYGGAAAGAVSPACVMLGTGIGFACMKGSRVRIGFDQRPHLILWNRPFLDGITEDYVSRRAIRARYAALAGEGEAPEVEKIANLAFDGEAAALETFRRTGRLLAQILFPVLGTLGCDRLVLGGQIARSAELFIKELREGLPVDVVSAAYPDDAALRGAARYCLLPKEQTVDIVTREK